MSGTPRDQLAQFLRDDLQRAASEAEPIADDVLEAYVDGTLDAVDREILETRLEDDAALRAEVEDLRALRLAMTPPAAAPVVSPVDHRAARAGRRRWMVPLGLAAAALVALVVWRATRAVPYAPTQAQAPAAPAVTPREASPPSLAVELQDRDRRLGLTADNRLVGVDGLAPGLADQLTAALRDGRLPPSAVGARVSSAAGLMLSAEIDDERFRPVRPIATAVATARPTLRWTALRGAVRYRVRIVDDRLETVAESPALEALAWRPTTPLPSGRVLSWQVEADTADGPRTTPAPPLPEARFAVLAPAEAARAEAAMREATSDLAVAVLATEAGLYDDADAVLRRLGQDNPGSRVVEALRADLLRRRLGGRAR